MTECTRRPEEKLFPFYVWLLAQYGIGQRNNLAADVCKKIAQSPRKLLRE
jgi:hypothetical protein